MRYQTFRVRKEEKEIMDNVKKKKKLYIGCLNGLYICVLVILMLIYILVAGVFSP